MKRLIPGLLLVLLLAGCGTKPGTTGASSVTTPSSTVSSTHKPVVYNDLAAGATTHTLHAGDITLSIRYWSTLPMDQWTPSAAAKPVSLSITATGTDVPTYVTGFTATATPAGGTGEQVYSDTASTTPGYAIRKPMSYQPIVTVPALSGHPDSVVLQVEIKLLSGASRAYYLRQDVVDTLTVALAS